jgi:hypothetical protein
MCKRVIIIVLGQVDKSFYLTHRIFMPVRIIILSWRAFGIFSFARHVHGGTMIRLP